MTFTIGQKIKHGPAYPMTCSQRFGSVYDDNFKCVSRNPDPTPLFLQGESFVIGLKMAIMGEYKYQAPYSSQNFEEPYPDQVPGTARGKREECLVCVKNIKKFSPFLVRKKDIIL